MYIKFKTSKVEGLFVKVPNEYKNFNIQQYSYAGTWLMETDSKNLNHWKESLPKGDYTVVGLLNNITTEEQTKCLIDTIHIEIAPSPSNDMGGDWDIGYVDYENLGEYAGWGGDAGCFRKAVDSFNSLINSLKIDTNLNWCIIIKKTK